MKTDIDNIISSLDNVKHAVDIMGETIAVNDIVSITIAAFNKLTIGYVYYVDENCIYISHIKGAKEKFELAIRHPERMCLKINSLYKSKNLSLPEKGEIPYKRKKKYLIFCKNNKMNKWMFIFLEPNYEIKADILNTIKKAMISYKNEYNFDELYYLERCAIRDMVKLTKIENDFFKKYQYLSLSTFSMLRLIRQDKAISYTTFSEKFKKIKKNIPYIIESICDNGITATDTQTNEIITLKNTILNSDIWNINRCLTYYDSLNKSE